ncbi:hypothetical protein, partial [Paenibacillus xylanexedens]|uniref:hypothetical protein n=1 Tax=Paenibacillus xylanexedens TaxID=528191 RepID=UPI001C92C558
MDEGMKNGNGVRNMVKRLLYCMGCFDGMEFYRVGNELEKMIGSGGIYFYCYGMWSENECVVWWIYDDKVVGDVKIRF